MNNYRTNKFLFLLQINEDNEFIDTFVYDTYQEIKHHNWLVNKSIQTYDYLKIKKIEDINLFNIASDYYEKNLQNIEYIPVGSVQFVESFLKTKNIIPPKPLNIPTYLRKVRYAKHIIEDLQYKDVLNNKKYDNYYIKSALKYKDFNVTNGKMMKFDIPNLNNEYELFVSSPITPPIKTEFRAFIIDTKLINISNYISENIYYDITETHVNLLHEIIDLVSKNDPKLRAYTIDYAITQDEGLSLIELHHGYSCGNYGFRGDKYLDFVIKSILQLTL